MWKASNVFKILFGNLIGGLTMFHDNPSRRKPRTHDAADLKSHIQRDGSLHLHQPKRKLDTDNYQSLQRVQKKVKAGSDSEHGVDGNGDENKKKNIEGECMEEHAIFDYPEGNGVKSSHNIPPEEQKNGGLLNDRKGEEGMTEELVQTKKEKKKEVSLKQNQPSAQEDDVGEFRETSAAKHAKRPSEEDDGNIPHKKIKGSNLKSDGCVCRNGNADVEIRKGLAVSNIKRAEASEKSESALGKRKWDDIEEEYEVRHGMEVSLDDASAQIGSVAKYKLGRRKRDDEGADMVIMESSFDDDKKLQRTIIVGNLPLRIKKKMLINEFSQFGEVESMRLRSVPILDSKLPRKSAILGGHINDSTIHSVHAYIVFKDEESVTAALSHNMVEFAGNHMRVDRARPPCKKLKGENNSVYDSKRTVLIGNLPFDVKNSIKCSLESNLLSQMWKQFGL